MNPISLIPSHSVITQTVFQTAQNIPAPLLSDDSCAVFDDITALRAGSGRRGSQSTSIMIKAQVFQNAEKL